MNGFKAFKNNTRFGKVKIGEIEKRMHKAAGKIDSKAVKDFVMDGAKKLLYIK